MTAIAPDIILNLRERRHAGEPIVHLAAEVQMSWQKLWGFLADRDATQQIPEKSPAKPAAAQAPACVPVTFADYMHALRRLRQAQFLTAAVGDKGLPGTAWARFQARRREHLAEGIRFWRKESTETRKSLGLPPVKWFKATPIPAREKRMMSIWREKDSTPNFIQFTETKVSEQ
jgi:hypothetical protein